MKNVRAWDFLERMFHMRGPTFERMEMNLIYVATSLLYDRVVNDYQRKYSMPRLVKANTRFKHHRFALCATDVTF